MENVNEINREHDPNYVNKLKESLHIKKDLPDFYYDWHNAKKENPCPAEGYKSLSPKVEVKTPLGEGIGYFNCTDNDWLVELNGTIGDELQAYKDVTHWRYINNKSILPTIIAKHFNTPPDEIIYNKITAIVEEYVSQKYNVSNKDIEKWARTTPTSEINEYWSFADDTRYREGLEDGAKHYKDGKIKSIKNKNYGREL